MTPILTRSRAWSLVRDVCADRSGASIVLIALVLGLLVGAAGLGVEASLWYGTKRNMQGAADAAAYGAVLAGSANYTTEADSIAAAHGFVNGENGTTVTVNNPPLSGHYVGDSAAYEVIIQQTQSRLLSVAALGSNPTVVARAVGLQGSGPSCVLALSGTAQVGTSLNGTTAVDLESCGLTVNASDAQALSLVGGSSVTAQSVSVVGDIDKTSKAAITVTGTTGAPVTGAPTAPDPLANLPIPSNLGACTTPPNGSKNAPFTTVDAGGGTVHYCGSISLQGQKGLVLQNGTFVLDANNTAGNGSLSVNNSEFDLFNATLILTDVAGDGANTGTISFNGGATINAFAPCSSPSNEPSSKTNPIPCTSPLPGTYAGIAIYVDRRAPAGGSDSFAGGTTQNITGVIYDPSRNVTFSGGTNTGNGNQCTKLIAATVTFNGNAQMTDNCATVFGTNNPIPETTQASAVVE